MGRVVLAAIAAGIMIAFAISQTAADVRKEPDPIPPDPAWVPQEQHTGSMKGVGPAPRVYWSDWSQEDAAVLFLDDAGIRGTTRHLGARSWLPPGMRVGTYRAVARLGNACAVKSFTVTEQGAMPPILSDWKLEPGRGVLIRVVRSGKPVAGATIYLKSYNGSREGLTTAWGKTDRQGRFLMAGLPEDFTSIYGSAVEGGRGRGFEARVGEDAEVTVELGD